MKEKIVIAMSGGVDSSTAAAILKEQGYDVVGVSMKVWDYSETKKGDFGTCCSLEDIHEARRVAEKLDIPFYVLDLKETFKKEVIDYFVEEYLNGKTPNPCIPCNSKLKFTTLVEFTDNIGASKIATGHYAFIKEIDNRYLIHRGKDRSKDQSYFLFDLNQTQIKRILFPLGKMTKFEVRNIARKFQLKVADKQESQEICFIPDNNYGGFISKQVGKRCPGVGDIYKDDGQWLGKHKGIFYYTIGQRKGLGIGWKKPLYVSEIDVINNRVIVTEGNGLWKKKFKIKNVNWSILPPKDQINVQIQIRSRHVPTVASLKILDNKYVEADFLTPQMSVSPGQAAVFYNDDIVIGGGWIEGVY